MTLAWLLLVVAGVAGARGAGSESWYVAALLPARAAAECRAGNGGGGGPDATAARAAVALDWALHTVSHRWPWPPLRLRLLDTCGGRARAAAQAAELALAGTAGASSGAEGVAVAALTWALPPADAATVDDVLAAGALAALAPSRARPPPLPPPLAPPPVAVSPLQVLPGAAAGAQALLALLRHLGWSLVSAAAAPDDRAQEGLRAFRHLAAQAFDTGDADAAPVCIAVETNIGHTDQEADAALSALVRARAAGARAVLLWAGAGGAGGGAGGRLLRAAERALGLGALQPEELFWLAVDADQTAAKTLRRAARALGGVLLFRAEYAGVAAFADHLKELRHVSAGESGAATRRRGDLLTALEDEEAVDEDNPRLDVSIEQEDGADDRESAQLLKAFYQQILSQRGNTADETEEARADFAAVQAALALRAAAAALRHQLCPGAADALCSHNLSTSELRIRFNAALREVAVPRADADADDFDAPGPQPAPLAAPLAAAGTEDAGAGFAFGAGGAGNLSVEILNLRRRPRERERGQQADAAFERVGRWNTSRGLLLTGRLLLYKGSGEAVPAQSLASQCTAPVAELDGSLGGCERCALSPSASAPTAAGRPGGLGALGAGGGGAGVGGERLGPRAEAGPPTAPLRLLAVLPVREAAPGLRCGAHVFPAAVEQAEALIWAVEQVNANASGAEQVALTVLDSCNSGARAARLIADALATGSGAAAGAGAGAGAEVAAVVVGGDDDHAEAALLVAQQLKVPALAVEALGPAPARRPHAPFPLTLAPSHAALAAAALALLRRLRWRCFAAVYLQDAHHFEHVFRLVERGAAGGARGGPRLSRALALPLERSSWARALTVELRAWGSAASSAPGASGAAPLPVLLLLPAAGAEAALRAARALELQGEVAPGAFAWVLAGAAAGDQLLRTYPEQAFGALEIRASAGRVERFEQGLRALRLDGGASSSGSGNGGGASASGRAPGSRNPWLPAFWSAVFHCRGAACRSPLYASLETYKLSQNAPAVNSINAVLTVAHALDTVRRKLCPELSRVDAGSASGAVSAEATLATSGGGVGAWACPAVRDAARVRQLLWEVAPRMAFVGAGLHAVAFSAHGESLHSDIEIVNYQRDSGGELQAVVVGSARLDGGQKQEQGEGEERGDAGGEGGGLTLRLDSERVRVYAAGRRAELTAAATAAAQPRCPGLSDDARGGATGGTLSPRAIELATARGPSRLRLLAVMPAHAAGEGGGWLACGALRPDAALLAAAAAFALHQHQLQSQRQNASASRASVGALLVDTCEQAARAFSSVYGLLDMAAEADAEAEEPVAALLLEPPPPAPPLLDLLRSQRLALLQLAPSGRAAQPPALPAMASLSQLLSGEAFVAAALALMRARGSHSVLVVRGGGGGSNGGWAAAAAAALQAHAVRHRDICVAGVYVLHRRPRAPAPVPGAQEGAFEDIADAREVTRRLRSGTTALLLLERAADVRLFVSLCAGLKGVSFLAAAQPADVPALAEYAGLLALTPASLPADASSTATRQAFSAWLRTALAPAASTPAPFPASWLEELRQALCSGAPAGEGTSAPDPTPLPQADCPDLEELLEARADALRYATATALAVAEGVDAFVAERCKASAVPASVASVASSEGDDGDGVVASLRECLGAGGNASAAREAAQEALRSAVESAAVRRLFAEGSFHVWSGNRRVGSWSRGQGLTLDGWNDSGVDIGSGGSGGAGGAGEAACSAMECTACAGGDGAGGSTGAALEPPSVYHTLQGGWASTLGAASLLGALLSVLTALYFLAAAALPRAKGLAGGTSPLGYLILLGLLLLFAGNVSFVLAPSPAICGARRFVPPLAYALAFSAMLLKVLTTWQLCASNDIMLFATGAPAELVLARPAVLITAACALTSVQALVSGGWLLLLPPRALPVDPLEAVDEGEPQWRCYPHGRLEAHLLLSMAYSFLLLAATAAAAALCCRRGSSGGGAKRAGAAAREALRQRRAEARWILVAASATALCLCGWGAAAGAQLPPQRAALASALAHLLAGIALLLCIYVPKVLLYTRLKAAEPSTTSNGPSIFDVSQFQPQPVKTLPGLLAMPQMMGLGPELGPPSVEDDDDDDPTQEVPGALYENMFSPGPPASMQAAGSSTGSLYAEDFGEEEDDEDVKGHHCEPGTNEFTAKLSNVLVVDGDQISFQEGISHM